MVQCFHTYLFFFFFFNYIWFIVLEKIFVGISLKQRMNICSCEGNLFLPSQGAWEYSWSGTTVD